MNAVLTQSLPPQRETDTQRRVDQAVRFAVWACARPAFPTPTEITGEFGVSRRTCSRWRKSLSRALAAGAALPAPHGRRPAVPVRASAADIASDLAAHAPVLNLTVALLVRDIRRRYRCARPTAHKAISQAMAHVACASVSRGASA